MPYVSTTSLAGQSDSASALEALAACEGVDRAVVMPGLPPGRGWAAAASRWSGRLLLHHAALAAPGDWRWNLAAKDESWRQRSLAAAKETMRAAADLGGPFYSVHAGLALEAAVGPDGVASAPADRARALEQLARSLDPLASLADTLGLDLLVENAAGGAGLFTTPGEIAFTFDRLAAPPLGLLLDLGHLVITCHARRHEPEAVLGELAHYVRALAVSDNDARHDTHAMPREDGAVLALAREAGAGRWPVLLEPRGLDASGLREALSRMAPVLQPISSELKQV